MSTSPTPVKAALDRCLDWAIAHDDFGSVQPWLDARAMPNPEPCVLDACLQGAIESDNLVCAEWLLQIGANPNALTAWGEPLTDEARSRPMVMLLFANGAVFNHARSEASRLLLGLCAEPDSRLLACSPADFLQYRAPRYGICNGEDISSPFHISMIESGESAYGAGEHFKFKRSFSDPEWKHIWNVARFGQSTTLLPDGRYVQIGGEHEDYYDPDLFIYNDVIVHTLPDHDGETWQRQVLAYPQDVFPPTDFHSATLVGDDIIVIGGLRYADKRIPGHTSVYALHIPSMQFRTISCTGDAPGWIYKHQAQLIHPGVIRVFGGTEFSSPNKHVEMAFAWELDLSTAHWSCMK